MKYLALFSAVLVFSVLFSLFLVSQIDKGNPVVVTKVSQQIKEEKNTLTEPVAVKAAETLSLASEKILVEEKIEVASDVKDNSESLVQEDLNEEVNQETDNQTTINQVSTPQNNQATVSFVKAEAQPAVTFSYTPLSQKDEEKVIKVYNSITKKDFIFDDKIGPGVAEKINQDGQAPVLLFYGGEFNFLPDEFTKEMDLLGVKGVAGLLNRAGFERFKDDKNILRIEMNRPLEIATVESFPLIGADKVLNLTISGVGIDGRGLDICLLDTGLNYTLPEFGSCTTGQINGSQTPACQRIPWGSDWFNWDPDPMDDNGHGTMVAAIVAGNSSNYFGLAAGSRLVPMKITNTNGISGYSNLFNGLQSCLSSRFNITVALIGVTDTANFNNANNCDAQSTATQLIDGLTSVGIIVIAPTGNSGYTTGISYPSCTTNGLGIGAVEDGSNSTTADNIWSNGNRGNLLDLLAPGSVIRTLDIAGNPTYSSGTSLSAAHAAGAALLLIQHYKLNYDNNIFLGGSANNAQVPTLVRNAFISTGVNISDSGSGLTFSRLDLWKALDYEMIGPNLTLISPANNTKNLSTSSAAFSYKVTDHHGVSFCSLYLDNRLNQTQYNVAKNITQSFSFSSLSPGNHNWYIVCSDNVTWPNLANSTERLYRVNYPPTISIIPLQNINEDSSLVLLDLNSYINNQDSDTLNLQITMENTSQVDCGFSSFNLTFLPAANYYGNASCTLTVSDGWENATTTVNIKVISINDLPNVTSTPVTNALINSSYLYDVNANDTEGDTLTYTLTVWPSGMAINFSTGVISWKPVSGQQGNHSVTVQVNDGNGSVTQTFIVMVANRNPIITSTPITSASIGAAYSYDVEANDADSDTLTYALINFPNGMSINPSTGLISWMPNSGQQGNQLVFVLVNDSYGGLANQSFTIALGNRAPVFTSTPILTAKKSNLYIYQATATDEDNDILTYSLGQNPSGMAVNSTTGLISWLPSGGQLGSAAVTLRVSDGFNQVEQQFMVATTTNLGGVINSCEAGPFDFAGQGTRDNQCVPSACSMGEYSLILNEHHLGGTNSEYNRVYQICLKGVSNASLLLSESGNPANCPSNMFNFGLIPEIHQQGKSIVTRNYRICAESSQVYSGEIMSCYSEDDNEGGRCTAPACTGNKVSLGEIVDIEPIFAKHGAVRNWKFRSYRICVE